MKKGQNTAIIILLALILVTLAVLCVVLISNRLQPAEQSASNQQQMEETEQAEAESPKEEAGSSGQNSESKADSPQKEKEEGFASADEEAGSETMKQVDVSCPVQDKVSGVIEGETIELSLEVPSSWQQADTGTTFYQEDGTKGAEGFFATKVPEGQTIWSTAKVDLTPGYVSSQTVTIQGQEVLLSICSVPWGKEQELPEDQKEYCYNYYVPYQDVYITIQIYAVGKDNAEAMQLHKEILESISFPSEALTFQTATFSWENQSNKNLTLQVDVPDTWIAEKDADTSTIDRHFNNENGLKIAGSFGIVYTLSEGESLQSLQNPANLPTSILESNLVVIGDKEFLLEKANLSDPLRPELFVYNYCFEQDGAVMNFYFYNDSDDQTQIPLYETILDSIDATIS